MNNTPTTAPVPRPARFLAAPATALGRARIARGWTQNRAAHAMTTTATAWGWSIPEADSLTRMLRRWESGHQLPAPDYAMLLAAVYDQSPGQLGIDRAPATVGA